MNCHSVESAAMRLIHVLVEMMNTFVVVPWRMCSASPCSWWCLCCNRWLCWIALILVAIITFVFWLLYPTVITLLTSCENLCVLLATFNQARGAASVMAIPIGVPGAAAHASALHAARQS